MLKERITRLSKTMIRALGFIMYHGVVTTGELRANGFGIQTLNALSRRGLVGFKTDADGRRKIGALFYAVPFRYVLNLRTWKRRQLRQLDAVLVSAKTFL